MEIIRILVFIFICSIGSIFYNQYKNILMKSISFLLHKIKFTFQKIYRLLNVKKASLYVWMDLIQYHKSGGWNFGQFDKDKYIHCSFKIDDVNHADFRYSVTQQKLLFQATVLESFDEERTNAVLVLASHFNGLLTFGLVKVNLKYNFVEFVYFRDTLTYALFSGEIETDTDTHFKLTKDIAWSFSNLVETGDDPVFVFSELMRKREEESKEKSISDEQNK